MSDYMRQYKRNLRAMDKISKATPQPGEVWWVSNLDGIKDRPVLIFGHDGNGYYFRKCTSQFSISRPYDIIEDYYDAGLDKSTYVDPEMRLIGRSRLVRKMGELSEFDRGKFFQ